MTGQNNTPQNFDSDVELVSTALTKYLVDWKEPSYPRTLDVLIYALSGSGTFFVNGQMYTVQEGYCFWLPSGVTVSMLPIGEEFFFVQNFRFRISNPLLRKRLQDPFPPIKVDNTLKSMLIYLMENLRNQDFDSRERIKRFSNTILDLLCLEKISAGRPESAYILTDGYSPATKHFLTFWENNIYSGYSMEEVGRLLGYNKNYLSAIFSKDTGHSIRDYTNFHRARAASIFFFCWEVGVEAAYEELLFNSINHFSKVFKRFVGIPPSNFRKACVSLSAEERSLIVATEPLLSYRIMPIDDLFAALRHMGQTMAEVLERKRL